MRAFWGVMRRFWIVTVGGRVRALNLLGGAGWLYSSECGDGVTVAVRTAPLRAKLVPTRISVRVVKLRATREQLIVVARGICLLHTTELLC